MESWQEEIIGSVAYTKAGELKKLASNLDLKNITNAEQDYADRIVMVVDEVLSKLDNSDARLINKTALAGIGNALTNALGYFQSWLDGGGMPPLQTSAQAEIDNALQFLPTLAPTQDVPEAKKAVTSLRLSVVQHRRVVNKLIEELETRGGIADKAIDEKVADALTRFEKLQIDVNELGTNLSIVKDSAAQVSTAQQTAFTKAEADRSSEFTKLLSIKQTQLDDSLVKLEEHTQKSVSDIREKVEADESAISEAKKRAEKILGIIGNEALTGEYSKNAQQEHTAANTWRLIATWSIIGAITAAVIFAFTVSDKTSWQHVLSKTIIVLSFGGLAGYAARQSSEHRLAQRNAEKMALQLAAIKPYLSDVTDNAKRDDLLVRIADRLFGQTEPVNILSKTKIADSPILTTQLIEALLELIKREKI
jgi:hypothetical protein